MSGALLSARRGVLGAFNVMDLQPHCWFHPGSLAGFSDGVAVALWPDSSGKGRPAGQATSTRQPILKTNIQNGLSIVRGDGVDDLLLTGAFTLNQPFMILAAMRWRSLSAVHQYAVDGLGHKAVIFQKASSTDVAIYGGVTLNGPTAATDAWRVYAATFNGASSDIAVDDGTPIVGNAGALAAGGLALFAAGTGTANAAAVDIGEVVACPIPGADLLVRAKRYLSRWKTP